MSMLSRPARRTVSRLVRSIAVSVVPILALSVAPQPAFAAPLSHDRPEIVQSLPAKTTKQAVKPRKPSTPSATVAAASFPAGGSAELALPGDAQVSATVGGLPLGVQAVQDGRGSAVSAASSPTGVRLQVLNRAASTKTGMSTPVVAISRADGVSTKGRVRVELAYSQFAGAYGGDYGARLRLVELPACALTTPERPECRSVAPIESVNNGDTRTLSATVEVASASASVVAALASDVSSQGDYAATKLSPSSKWDVSLASGAFTWSYPIRVPGTPGGMGPEINLGYSSQTVDGRTASTNNQGSWIGEGFSYEPGYVERRYKPCADDGHDGSGDQCWAFYNASLVLGGRSSDMIKINSNLYKLEKDDGTRVERLTGTVNGDGDGEYWKVTTPDGTQYFFGLNRLPGWVSGKEETGSAWTAPVSGDDVGEPCYNSAGWTSSFCDQGWRWNLDYVKDLHGNVISYFYGKETNSYAKASKTDVNGSAYVRGGWLKRVDYGQADGTVYTTNAAARVRFDTAERCLATGSITCAESELTDTTAWAWPDVPWDRNCAASTHCATTQTSETFWTRKRLTTITTEIRSGSSWSAVEKWDLRHKFTDNGDGSKTLWLDKIDHSGLYGTTETMPTVQLIGIQMDNRVDSATDNLAPLKRYRLSTIYTETGGEIQVNYSAPDCSASALPAEGASTKRCYPVKWDPFGTPDPYTDWFHKYVVSQVTAVDRTGGNPDQVTQYEYGVVAAGDQDPVDGAGWRKTLPDGITKDEDRTWSDWRGYPKVTVRKGDMQTLTTRVEHVFFRGLDGDATAAGGPRSVKVTDSTGATYVDKDELAGTELESVTYDGSKIVSKSLSTSKLWVTQTQTETWGDRTATMLRPEVARTLTALAPDAQGNPVWRETKTVTAYDTTWGRVTQVDDLGDISTAADDKCIRTAYADSPGLYLYELTKLVETFAVNCSVASPNRATQLLSSDRTSYDGQAYGAAPTKGDVTRTEKLDADDGTTTTYLSTTMVVDDYGRVRRITDPMGYYIDTAYTDIDGLNVQKKVTDYPTATLSYSTTTEYSPAYGDRTAETDPNGRRYDFEYDGLGRLTKVWDPTRQKSLGYAAGEKYTYSVRADKPTVITTESIRNDGTYAPSYELFDSFLRSRQTQLEGPSGGWVLADTLYTPTGQKSVVNSAYFAAGTPGDAVLIVPEGSVNGQTKYVYDGADRVSVAITAVAGDEKWRTTTSYGGDRTSIDPPTGDVPVTSVTNARGQLVALYQYKGDGPGGDADVTTYTYTPAGQQETITGPDGAVWRYTYFQNGRKRTAEDPDAGTTTYGYDKNGNLTSATDTRPVTLSYVYDRSNRQTEKWQGLVGTGTKLAAWTYDSFYKGQLAGTSRFANGKTYYVTYPVRDGVNRVLKTSYIIPNDAGTELAKTYDFSISYNIDGTVAGTGNPAAGGLPAESLVIGYDALRRPVTLTGNGTYVTDTKFAATGEMLENTLFTGGKKAWQKLTYERGTGRVLGMRVDRQDAAVVDMDSSYAYDDAGNVLSIVDAPAGSSRDVQCFTYDDLRRLTEAWTTDSAALDPCAGGDVLASGVGGAAAYHEKWTFRTSGDRDTETVYSTTGGPAKTRTYKYPAANAGQPHTLRGVDETVAGVTTQYAYDVDSAGNTKTRGTAASAQQLVWDAEGHLASSTPAGGQATTFIYDADGNRLVRKEPNATTLYLGNMEVRLDLTTRQVAGTRYYSFGDRTVAVRTAAGVSFQLADPHNTNQAVVDAVTGVIAWRRTTPYGGARGGTPASWPDQRGFVGGTIDATSGLTHLGAREYDPSLGRFVSVDPIFDQADPQSWNGYAYSDNNPLSKSDASGTRACDDDTNCATTSSASWDPHSVVRPHQTETDTEKCDDHCQEVERARMEVTHKPNPIPFPHPEEIYDDPNNAYCRSWPLICASIMQRAADDLQGIETTVYIIDKYLIPEYYFLGFPPAARHANGETSHQWHDYEGRHRASWGESQKRKMKARIDKTITKGVLKAAGLSCGDPGDECSAGSSSQTIRPSTDVYRQGASYWERYYVHQAELLSSSPPTAATQSDIDRITSLLN